MLQYPGSSFNDYDLALPADWPQRCKEGQANIQPEALGVA